MLVVCVTSVHLVKRFPGLSVRGQYTPKPPVVFDPVAEMSRPIATAPVAIACGGTLSYEWSVVSHDVQIEPRVDGSHQRDTPW